MTLALALGCGFAATIHPAAAQLGEEGSRGFGGEGSLYFGGVSLPAIILYSVIAAMVAAVIYTVAVIGRNEVKRRAGTARRAGNRAQPGKR
ncbi:MAG: hypothetical protein ABI361_08790 [Nitrososphaera sp.]